jgi:hypothetical protein
MHKIKINGVELEADTVDLSHGRLVVTGDPLTIAGLQFGGRFETMLSDDIEFSVTLPEGQLGFSFTNFCSMTSITYLLEDAIDTLRFVETPIVEYPAL